MAERSADVGLADLTAQMAALYIESKAPDLTAQTDGQLQASEQAAEWLRQTHVSAPSTTEARAQQTISTVLQPVAHLGRRRVLRPRP